MKIASILLLTLGICIYAGHKAKASTNSQCTVTVVQVPHDMIDATANDFTCPNNEVVIGGSRNGMNVILYCADIKVTCD